MTSEELFFRRAVVCVSALIYWAGVWFQARRVRRHIGRSANVRPRGAKEKLLWAGWVFVVAVWLIQPFFAGRAAGSQWLRFNPIVLHLPLLVLGVGLAVAGYAGTLWCYAAMGDAWRMGINRKEKNALVSRGPYRLVRHPIYALQVVMLVGAALLLPTLLSLIALAIHLLCVGIKARDEESYLLTVHGEAYRDYVSRTGRLLPKIGRSATH
jgi:protein-S-isoprenylcysteine O-methyltransferase Ste14